MVAVLFVLFVIAGIAGGGEDKEGKDQASTSTTTTGAATESKPEATTTAAPTTTARSTTTERATTTTRPHRTTTTATPRRPMTTTDQAVPTTATRPRPRPGYISKDRVSYEWPFTVDSGTVACVEDGLAIIFTTGGTTYAINGTAQTWADQFGWHDIDDIWRYRPDDPAVRVSINPVFEVGEALC